MTATIGKHPERAGVWCVYVPCDACDGQPTWSEGEDGDWFACDVCEGTSKRILSTHATRDGAVVSCNQINQADQAEATR